MAVFVNVSFVVNKKLFNKFGIVVMGCALATTPLYGYDMKYSKDRFEFIIGFIALIISLSVFKDELSQINVDLILVKVSLANYLFYLICGFVFALHLYIIPYVFGFTRYSSLKVFAIIERLSYFLFAILAISPTVLFIFVSIRGIIKSIQAIDQKTLVSILAVLLILLIALAIISTILIVKKIIRTRIDEEYEEFVSQSFIGIEEAKDYNKDRLFISAYFRAFNVIELYLRKELLKAGHFIKYSRDKNLLHSAENAELLSPDVLNKIKEFVSMRNKIIHSEQAYCRSYAKNIIEFVEELYKNEKAI